MHFFALFFFLHFSVILVVFSVSLKAVDTSDNSVTSFRALNIKILFKIWDAHFTFHAYVHSWFLSSFFFVLLSSVLLFIKSQSCDAKFSLISS